MYEEEVGGRKERGKMRRKGKLCMGGRSEEGRTKVSLLKCNEGGEKRVK